MEAQTTIAPREPLTTRGSERVKRDLARISFAPCGAVFRVEVRDLRRPACRSRRIGADGSLIRVLPGKVGAALTKPGRASTARWCGFGERVGKEYVRNRRLTSFNRATGSNLVDMGRVRRAAIRCDLGGELAGRSTKAGPGGREEGLRAYSRRCRWDTVGLLLRRAKHSEHGNHPVSLPPGTRSSVVGGIGATTAERAGWGGAAVVVRGRESRSHGEGRQRFREGEGNCNAARRDAEWRRSGRPRNGSVGSGSGDAGQASSLGGGPILTAGSMTCSTSCTTRRRWSWRSTGSRAIAGARSPGVDGLTVADVEDRIGVSGFLNDLRAQLKTGSFRPLPGAGTQDPETGWLGQGPQAGDSHDRGPGRSGRFKTRSGTYLRGRLRAGLLRVPAQTAGLGRDR